ncbi:unnamed protein product [Malus baccata var. baccata]
MERTMRVVLLLIRFLAIVTITFSIGLCNGNPGWPPLCKESERQALLMFKQDLKDPANRLASWVAKEDSDCCSWTGVVCDHITGHIHELHLNNSDSDWDFNSFFGGKINPSLLSLKHLNYLDLSHNNFNGTQIPSFFGSMTSLTHLNLAYSEFYGIIPHKLGNLSSLRYLNLSSYNLKVENLQWISGLSLLKHLDLSSVYLSKASDWLQVTNMLPSLVELDTSYCELDQIPPLPTPNFTSLVVLDLSCNSFPSLMPSLNNLESLHLSYNALRGEISSSIGNMTSLVNLHLDNNPLEGKIPNSLGHLCKLKDLDLSKNHFTVQRPSEIFKSLSRCGPDGIKSLSLRNTNVSGPIPMSLGNMSSLEKLDISVNQFHGTFTEVIGQLKMLTDLDISYNLLEGDPRRPDPFPLSLSSVLWTLSPSFPTPPLFHFVFFLHSDLQVSPFHSSSLICSQFLTAMTCDPRPLAVSSLDPLLRSFASFSISWVLVLQFVLGKQHIGYGMVRDFIAEFKESKEKAREEERLAREKEEEEQRKQREKEQEDRRRRISSTIPTWFWNLTFQLDYLNLSHNQLYGEIQNIVAAPVSVVDLGSNQFTGALPIVPTSLYWLDLSNSSFSGSVFHFFCDRPDEPKQLYILRLGNNFLTGKVPDCWMSWQYLSFLNLENNNLIGNIPMSMGYLQYLRSLHLSNNHLYGELPHSLQNCTWLSVVDLSENGFSGSIPIWIGKSLSGLNVLNLRSNKFEGDIPNEVCYLKSLQILDLAHNKLSGMIPRCFHNLSAMANFSESFSPIFSLLRNTNGEVSDNAILVTKGIEMEYSKILGFVKVMDLSCNFMYGEIPEELTGLLALQSLNLSNNRFTGRIPSNIGNMARLESLDFSMNQLDGEIPPSMTNLTFLSHLNLAYNNLTGRIPESTQL